jgi:hypothetical protein
MATTLHTKARGSRIEAGNWIDANEDSFVLRRQLRESRPAALPTIEITDDDIPF